MLDIRKYKKLIGIILALILLSFFDATRQDVSAHTAHIVTVVEHGNGNAVLLATADNAPSGIDKFVAVESQIDEAITQEEKSAHEPLVRFIAVVFALFFAIQVVYHTTIRRYGCHMIDVWENVIYIHQIDGKKKNAFLRNETTNVLITGGNLWRKIKYVIE